MPSHTKARPFSKGANVISSGWQLSSLKRPDGSRMHDNLAERRALAIVSLMTACPGPRPAIRATCQPILPFSAYRFAISACMRLGGAHSKSTPSGHMYRLVIKQCSEGLGGQRVKPVSRVLARYYQQPRFLRVVISYSQKLLEMLLVDFAGLLLLKRPLLWGGACLPAMSLITRVLHADTK